MTVSTEISSNEYTGNGVTTDFDYKFRIFKANQLSVIASDADGDNVVTLRLGTDYTVTGANKSTGGKVILTKPLADKHQISISRVIPIVQETSFRNQGKFLAETHEDAFDYLTMLIQRIWGDLGSLYLKRPNILANWFDAKGYRIANLGKPKRDSDAVDLGTLNDDIEGVNSTILKLERRLLRVDDMDITALPKASERAGNVLTFDKDGRPIVVAPASGSAVDVLNTLQYNGDKIIGSSHGGSVYSDYNRSIFKRAGDFKVGNVVSSTLDSLLLNGKYYSYKRDVMHVVSEQEDIENDWICVGYLNGYPVNDIRNFGAVSDLVKKRESATDCSDAWELCYQFCKYFGYAMTLPDEPIYVTKSCKIGDLEITSESGKHGFADPYYGVRPDGTNFITGEKKANWEYFYNIGEGASKSWFDMISTARGCIVCSDKNISIFIKSHREKIKLRGVAQLGNHRIKEQLGLDTGSVTTYSNQSHDMKSVAFIGNGGHGVFFRGGWEISSPDEVLAYANNGAGIFVGKTPDITSPVEYLTFSKSKADHNRLGGLVFEHARKSMHFNDLIGNNNGQYDCPVEVDPLLGYYRDIRPTPYTRNAFLVDIRAGSLDTDAAYGVLFDVSFNNIKGEQIVDLVRIKNRIGNGVVNGLSINGVHITGDRKLTSLNMEGSGFLIDSIYLENVFFGPIYATEKIRKLELENITSVNIGTGTTLNHGISTSSKFKALVKRSGLLIDTYSTQETNKIITSDFRYMHQRADNLNATKNNLNSYKFIAMSGNDIQVINVDIYQSGNEFKGVSHSNGASIMTSFTISSNGNFGFTLKENSTVDVVVS